MKEKVGIITLASSDNYGNVLQNYAVQEIFRELGFEPETIINTTRYGRYLSERNTGKWRPTYIKKYVCNQLNYRFNIKNSGSGIAKTLYYCRTHAEEVKAAKSRRKNAFQHFEDAYIKTSENVIDINKNWTEEKIHEYKYFVSGSDQVWNPVYPETSRVNFLQFAPAEKRIALAPSFGVDQIPDELRETYAKWLRGIPFLSVREEQGQRIIRELCGRDAKVLCDPTIAVKKEKWTELESKPSFIGSEHYLLTYFLGDRTKEYDRRIAAYASEKELKIIHLYDVLTLMYYSVSPQEFVYLIHHADLVCTDSFHGAVFSIIMHTNFVAFPRIEDGRSMDSRISTLLRTFGLESRKYREVNREKVFETDFSSVDTMLLEKRKDIIDFLLSSFAQSAETPVNHPGDKPEKMTGHTVSATVYEQKTECCGCSGCAAVCPMDCITMEADDEGFPYPLINSGKCIHCGKCRTVCPVIRTQEYKSRQGEKKCWIAFSKEEDIRRNSSSGGIFTELAEYVLSENGMVYGAGFKKDFSVVHMAAKSAEALENLRGSKYVQSDMDDTFAEVKRNLQSGQPVYFSGTPCQVAGLYSFLGERPDNLFTQDFICHGVPSPLVWKKYIETFGDVNSVSFRDKKYGWHFFSLHIASKGKHYRKRLDEDFFLKLFLDNTILRPICYDCPVKSSGSCADITLADSWNVNSVTTVLKDTDQGLSLVIANTEKGRQLWKRIVCDEKVNAVPVETSKALDSQSALSRSAPCNPKRAVFFEIMKDTPMESLITSWYRKAAVNDLKNKKAYYKFCIKKLLTK